MVEKIVVNENTNIVDIAIDVSKMYDHIMATLVPEIGSLKSDLDEHNEQFSKYHDIAKMDKMAQANGYIDALDQYETKQHSPNPEYVRDAELKLELIADYVEWKNRKIELESVVKHAQKPILDLIMELNAEVGGKTIYKTHEKNGNKLRATGGTTGIGYQCEIIRMSDKSIVTYTDEDGNLHDRFLSINDATKYCTPRTIDKKTKEKKPYVRQGAIPCEHRLNRFGYAVRFLTRNS